LPLGNLTSQFFANIYLNELDQFVKHKLKIKYYIRYVDDFVILHKSKEQLETWKTEFENFLKEKLNLELHPDKSRIINLSKGVDFVGFRNFYKYKLLRKRNVKSTQRKISSYNKDKIPLHKLFESFEGWNAYAKWSNSYNLKKRLIKKIDFNKKR
jgi:RNA-directed DNA polymerase